ncbi:MAG: class I SAM-dependent methyltransferase [Sinobacteraceae bacterium]|nr:class I SAM-dependent methyltransferase [Nevskiaceae bacterium]
MYDSAEAARNCPRGSLRLVHDLETGMVFNAAFQPELLTYDSAYQNEQAHSAAFRSHLEEVASVVTRNLGTEGLVEVGCGKAFFLELLQSRGCGITGFDPTYEGSNPAVQRHLFGGGVAVHAKGIILRHVLEHIQDPSSFLRGLQQANGGGLIYIEVPCLDWIIRRKAWFDIFYEHVNYFRLADFERMFERVVHAGHLFGGQYLFVVADLASLRTPVNATSETVTFPEDFLQAAQGSGEDRSTSDALLGDTVWGAASKGVIYSLLRERARRPVKNLIDINPAKCGRFVPGTGLRVMSPEEGLAHLKPGAVIHVMNSNYMSEIRQATGNRFSLRGMDNE